MLIINTAFDINGDGFIQIMGQFKDNTAGRDFPKSRIIKKSKTRQHFSCHIYAVPLPLLRFFFYKRAKIANVAHVSKGNDATIFTNYRLVLVLRVLSKFIERLAYNRLVTYININRLLCKCQLNWIPERLSYIHDYVLIKNRFATRT